MQAKKTTRPPNPDFLALVNAMKLLCNVEKDTELAKIIGVSQQAVSRRKLNPPPIPPNWWDGLHKNGIYAQQLDWLTQFANNPGKIAGYITGGIAAANTDDGFQQFFAEIREWWKTTRDPSQSAFVLAFTAQFPDFLKWKERQPDIKNVEERGSAVEVTETA